MWNKINNQSKKLFKICKKNKLIISTAESCTGGLISASIVNNSGSSKIFNKSFVTYSNEAKIDEIYVDKKKIKLFGAVSKEISEEMFYGLMKRSNSNLGISITGIAGPDGGTKEKPVGLVWITVGNKKSNITKDFHFSGNRLQIRLASTLQSLNSLIKFVNEYY